MYFGNQFNPGGCKPPVPGPGPHPCYHDSYGHDCYHEHKGFPHPHLPTNGPFASSAFMLLNYYPYLVDTYNLRYGEIINVSENLDTRITQRPDASCLNLAAKFNLVEAINKNVVMEEFLEKCIAQNCDKFQTSLPLMKSKLSFRMYYTIYDDMGGVVDERLVTVSTNDQLIHYTDIRDFFLQSTKAIFVDNIPAYDYAGLYVLSINKLEMWMDTIDTPSHTTDGLNPYYQFVDNNQRIVLQHDTIEACPPDDTLLIAAIDINYHVPFQANITTRLRVSFTAFTSQLIVVNQTYGVWKSIYEPSEERIKNLEDKVATLEETVGIMQASITNLETLLAQQNETIAAQQTQINELSTAVSNLNESVTYNLAQFSDQIEALATRVTALENIPLATHKYVAGDDYIKSQLTWVNIGELYQVNNAFTATGNIQDEVDAGNIIPLTLVE